MVSEEAIEQAIEQVVSATEEVLVAFRQKEPVLYAYLMSDQFRLLTAQEQELLLFMALVIWSSWRQACEEKPNIGEEQIGLAEERNWTLWQAAGTGPFRHRLDVFFEGYAEEELLSYVEDSLLLEDGKTNELGVTPEGRVLLLISLKTVIDVLTGGEAAELPLPD